jgi:hypothetical protein
MLQPSSRRPPCFSRRSASPPADPVVPRLNLSWSQQRRRCRREVPAWATAAPAPHQICASPPLFLPRRHARFPPSHRFKAPGCTPPPPRLSQCQLTVALHSGLPSDVAPVVAQHEARSRLSVRFEHRRSCRLPYGPVSTATAAAFPSESSTAAPSA